MLANFFGKTNPANYVILFLLFLGWYLSVFFLGLFPEKTRELSTVDFATILGVFILAFFFYNFILTKNKLTLYNTYGFFFFTTLFTFFPETMLHKEELVLNLILLIFLRRVYSLRTDKIVIKKMFDSGFWLAILYILNPFSLVYLILLYTSIALFQKLNIKTFIIPIIGFITPVICYFTYCFWLDKTEDFIHRFSFYTDYNFEAYTSSNKAFYVLVFLGVLCLSSILFKTPKVFSVSGNYRKFWMLTILNFLVAIGFIIFFDGKTGAELMFLFFPISIILTNGIEGIQKQFLKNIILILCLVLPIFLLII